MKNDFSFRGKGLVSVVLLHVIINDTWIYSLQGSFHAPTPHPMLPPATPQKQPLQLPLSASGEKSKGINKKPNKQ